MISASQIKKYWTVLIMWRKKVLATVPAIKTGKYANIDLLPIPPERRKWRYFTFISIWLNMSASIPTLMLGASLIIAGFDIVSAVIIIAISSFIMGLIASLNAQPGTKYGIPYSVQARAAFGIRGAQIPNLIRAIVAAGWVGIELWIGGLALDALIRLLYSNWANLPYHIWYCFAAFLVINIVFTMYFKPGTSNRIVGSIGYVSTPLLAIVGVVWFWLLSQKIGDLQALFAATSISGSNYYFLFGSMLVIMAFYWSTAGLNISDFSRFASSQKEQTLGQIVGVFLGQVVYKGIGVIIPFMGLISIQKTIWNPIEVSGDLEFWFASFMLMTIILATLKTSIMADNTAINFALMNLYPKRINWLRATLITVIIGVLMQPWNLIQYWNDYIFNWINGYSIFLSAIIGILIVDYYILRKRSLILHGLYSSQGNYWYTNGINWIAIIALAVGIGAGFVGKFIPKLYGFYYYGPLIAITVGACVYLIFAKFCPSGSKRK